MRTSILRCLVFVFGTIFILPTTLHAGSNTDWQPDGDVIQAWSFNARLDPQGSGVESIYGSNAYDTCASIYPSAPIIRVEDGRTSVLEAMNGSDVGSRTTVIEGQNCKEFFAFKDGQPIKVICKD